MPLTQEQGRAALDHLLTVVLQKPARSPWHLVLAANGIDDVCDLMIKTFASISALKYPDPADASISHKLTLGQAGLLHAVIAFIRYRRVTGNGIQDGDWTALTWQEFDNFRADGSIETVMRMDERTFYPYLLADDIALFNELEKVAELKREKRVAGYPS